MAERTLSPAPWLMGPLVLAALYEPLRLLVSFELPQKLRYGVGGVGGVGGLMNLGDPTYCSSPAGEAGYYCFYRGYMFGLTPFAMVTLAFWIMPSILLAFFPLVKGGKKKWDCESMTLSNVYKWTWGVASFVWFVVPLVYFLGSSFYWTSTYHFLLAISLAAAFPLSWHLSLLPILVSSVPARILGVVGGLRPIHLHKFISKSAFFFAVLHGALELVYLLGNHENVGGFLQLLMSPEGLLYSFGILCLAGFTIQAALSWRKTERVRAWWPYLHRTTSVFVAITAAAHWWPFAIFFQPASALLASEMAVRWCKGLDQDRASSYQMSLSFIGGLLAQLLVLLCIWSWREYEMQKANASVRLAFLFPPLALILGFAAALTMSIGLLRAWQKFQPNTTLDSGVEEGIAQPLLDE